MLCYLCQFWETFWIELANKKPYKASIGGIRLKLAKLQKSDDETQKIKAKGLHGYKDINRVLHHQGLLFVPEIIWTKLISWHHDDPLAGHFGINKIRELIGRKYYWPSLKKDIEAYVKGYNVCLALKAVKHKPYGDLQALPVLTYW